MRVLIVAFVLAGTVFIAPGLLAQDEAAEPDSTSEHVTEDPAE